MQYTSQKNTKSMIVDYDGEENLPIVKLRGQFVKTAEHFKSLGHSFEDKRHQSKISNCGAQSELLNLSACDTRATENQSPKNLKELAQAESTTPGKVVQSHTAHIQEILYLRAYLQKGEQASTPVPDATLSQLVRLAQSQDQRLREAV